MKCVYSITATVKYLTLFHIKCNLNCINIVLIFDILHTIPVNELLFLLIISSHMLNHLKGY